MKNSAYTRRSSRDYMVRTKDVFEKRQRFLIVCEGKKTEPYYFMKFKTPSLIVELKGTGCNTISLVKEAIRLKSQDVYDQVWCVFDRDSFPSDNINDAFQLANSKKIKIAYSNESFELWYLLHFEYLTSSISRRDYISRISGKLGYKYEKNLENLYEELLPRQNIALQNSQKLSNMYDIDDPINNCPCTTVHILVEQLNLHMKPFRK